MACHHRLWAALTVGRRRAWHAIIAFGQHTQSNDIRRGMPSSPLESTHGRTTSGMAFRHSPWTTNTVKQRRAWHVITAFGQHTRSIDVGRCMPSSPLDLLKKSNGVKHNMPSSPFDGKHGRTMSGVACHHCLWVAQTVGWRRALHAIIAFGQHTQSNDVGGGMTSPPLDNTQGRQC